MMEATFDISGSLLDFYYWLNEKLMDDTVHSRLRYKNGDMALWVRGPAPDSEGGGVIVDGVFHHNDPDQQFQRVHEQIEGVLCFEGVRMPDGTTHIELVSHDAALEDFYNSLQPKIDVQFGVNERAPRGGKPGSGTRKQRPLSERLVKKYKDIRALHKDGLSLQQLADRFAYSRRHISDIMGMSDDDLGGANTR